jgi:hypothetical protein
MNRNLGGNRLRLTKEQREEILSLYLRDTEAGTMLAMSLGLSAAYAYRLANERGVLPVTRWSRPYVVGTRRRRMPVQRHEVSGDPAA